MQPKTEELLYVLLWSAEMLTRPTFRNMTESFEGWCYRNGLMRELGTLERRALLERDCSNPKDRLYRLTEHGRLHALGGRDPLAQWSRPWDKKWRFVIFDMPVAQNRRRDRLREYLRDRGFGCLQRSVWITPDPLMKEREILSGGTVNAASLMLLQGEPCGEESDADLVNAAWDFDRINANYAECLSVLEELPASSLKDRKAMMTLQQWGRKERAAWLSAVTADPLLPQPLLPRGYLGQSAWHRRVEVLRQAGRNLRGFAL